MIYDEVVKQEVPERFVEILRRGDLPTGWRPRRIGPYSSVREAMLAAVPSLRAFAIALCGNVDRADDLVQ